MDKSSFTVRHYAGDVEYDSTKFYDKNKDALFRDLYDMMTSSTNGVAKAIFPPKDKVRGCEAARTKSAMRREAKSGECIRQ